MTRRVVELLVEMVECADIVLLNKMDRLSTEQTEMLQTMVAELNSTAVIQPCSFGKVYVWYRYVCTYALIPRPRASFISGIICVCH